MATVVFGDFEWDSEKAQENVAKHGVTFEEAATAVEDHASVVLADEHASEDRELVIGMSSRARVLLVVTTERGDRDRIISARRATPDEERIYGGKA